MDYGPEWEAAWEEHVANWRPPAEDSDFASYQSIKEMEEVYDLQLSDIRSESSPEGNAMSVCWYFNYETNNSNRFQDPDWRKGRDASIISQYGEKGDSFVLPKNGWGQFWPCSIIAKEDSAGSFYTVRIFQSKSLPRTIWDIRGSPRILTHYPRSSIKYINKPYMSNLHLPNAFRHSIGLRDEIFPEQWKNRKGKDFKKMKASKYAVGDRIIAYLADQSRWNPGLVTNVIPGPLYNVLVDGENKVREELEPSLVAEPEGTQVFTELDPFYV